MRFGSFVIKMTLMIVLPQAVLAGTASETKPLNIMVCDTPEHAIAYTAAIDKGAAADEAKDIVGREAGAEVCDKFIGVASVEQENTLQSQGVIYKIVALKFSGVGKFKWSAIPQTQNR